MGRTLLLADDSVTIQKVVSLTFASEGVEIITANDGQEAIDKLGERIPDVALLDVFMPKRDGYEVCTYIKQNERLRNIPVILLVGAFEPFDQEKARLSGADDYLTKPFQSIRQLVTKVNDLLHPLAHAVSEELPPQASEETMPPPPQDELNPLALDPAPFASLELDDASIEVTSIYESADDTPEDFRQVAADQDFLKEPYDMPPLPAEITTNTSAPAYMLASTATLLDDNDHLLDLGELEASALFSEADDVLRIYEEIKLPQPAPVTEETLLTAEVPTPEVMLEDAITPAATATVAETMELSPATIDAIARRVVEMMSDRAVREIAWEVVPELADLHLKQRLETTK